MTFHGDPTVIRELRSMWRQGTRSAEMLRYLDARGLSQIEMMDRFREAFHLDSYGVGPIGGWFADGTGELDDAAVGRLLDAAIESATERR